MLTRNRVLGAVAALTILLAGALAFWPALGPGAPPGQIAPLAFGSFVESDSVAKSGRGAFLQRGSDGRFAGGAFAGHGFAGIVGTDPGEEVTAPLEALTGAQLTEQLGFGHEAIWEFIWLLNESASPVNPSIGTAPMSTVAGTPTYGATGPLDANDKGVSFTDGQVAQVASGNGAVTFGARLFEITFSANAGGNRFILGHDGTEDAFVQYMQTSNQLRGVLVGGTIGTVTASVAFNHNNAASHTVLMVGIIGANFRIASEMGVSSATSIAAEAAFDFASTWRIAGSNAFPGVITYMAVAISDGSTLENNAVIALYDNIQTAVTNYRTATGR
jgi:hypothetical protein